jgi:hypothetical protein
MSEGRRVFQLVLAFYLLVIGFALFARAFWPPH